MLVFLLWGAVGAAQQTVPFRGTTPIAPSGIPAKALPEKPVEFDTAEGQKIRVVPVVRGLANPWSLAFLPDGGMLVTERGGQLRIIRNGVLDPTPVAGVPMVRATGLSGLMDIALHPQFAQNRFGTGHLERILFNEKMEELRRESLLGELRQRIRDVRQGPAELLYALTDDRNGGLLRIEPAQ